MAINTKNFGVSAATNRIRPVEDATTVVPHDTNALATTAVALYIGTGGNIKVTTVGGTAITFTNVQDGSWFPVSCTLVWSTGTTASNIVALHD